MGGGAWAACASPGVPGLTSSLLNVWAVLRGWSSEDLLLRGRRTRRSSAFPALRENGFLPASEDGPSGEVSGSGRGGVLLASGVGAGSASASLAGAGGDPSAVAAVAEL